MKKYQERTKSPERILKNFPRHRERCYRPSPRLSCYHPAVWKAVQYSIPGVSSIYSLDSMLFMVLLTVELYGDNGNLV